MTERKPLMDPSEIEAFAKAARTATDQTSGRPNESGEDTEFAALSQEVFHALNKIAGQERFLIAEVITQS